MRLPATLRRIAAWSILLALIAIVYTQIAVPVVQEYRTLAADIDTKQRLATKLNQAIVDNDKLARNAEQDIARINGFGGLLNAVEGGQADTEIREYFVEAVRASGGKIQSSQNLLVETEEVFHRHTLRANISADIDQLAGLLHRLESRQPFLFVERLQIHSQQNAATSEHQNSVLRIQLNLVGYSNQHDDRR